MLASLSLIKPFCKNSHLFVILFGFLSGIIWSATAEPLLNTPRFEHLSTDNGLSQDSVNDLLIDSDGLLWVATETGLNRYDGHHVKHFTGLNNEFADDGIYALFEDEQHNLWVSTFSSGVYTVDRQTGKSERVLAITYKDQPSWYQYASHFIQGPDNSVYIAYDHLVVRYHLASKTWTTVFDLLAQHKTAGEDDVIRFLNLFDDTLFIATSTGLFTYHQPSKTIRKAEYINASDVSIDQHNAKHMLTDRLGNLWLGTVEGLFRLSAGELAQFAAGHSPSPQAQQVVERLNIWDMVPINNTLYYLATDQGLFTFDTETEALQQIFQPSDSNLLITNNNLTKIAPTVNNQLWLSTTTSGVLLWTPRSLLFNNVYASKATPHQLSNNMVLDFHRQDDTYLWVGTNNGLNRYNTRTGQIESYLVSADKKAVTSSGSIYIIREGEDDWVWLVTYDGMVKFDLASKQVIPLSVSAPAAAQFDATEAYDILRLSPDHYIVASEKRFLRFNTASNTMIIDEVLSTALDTSQFYTFIADYQSRSDSVLISMTGGLWRYNVKNSKLTKIHDTRHIQSEYVIQPTEAILDDNNQLWISYPGHGLYVLNASTYEPVHFFDTSNLLPTNIVFSLTKDAHGYLWMGSHKGLLQLDPKSLSLKQFTTKEGLVSNEFNWGAKVTLNNGNMVFGSQKGFTVFDPDAFEQSSSIMPATLITDVSLISRQLELGTGSKNNRTVELDHNDIGLTIRYSDMQFDLTNTGYYQYELQGDMQVSYPPTRATEVTFPRLDPGEYTFTVQRFDMASNKNGPIATLVINVAYPLFASPAAYLCYSVCLIVTFVFIAWRRQIHRNTLKAAHISVVRNKNRLSMALTASNTRIWEWRQDTNLLSQDRLNTELGYSSLDNTIDFEAHCALIHAHDIKMYLNQWRSVLCEQHKKLDVTYRLKNHIDEYEWYRDVGSLVSADDAGGTVRMAGTYSNITESINTQTKAQLYGEAFEHTRDWVVIFDGSLHPIIANHSFKEALGFCPEQDIASQLDKVLSGQKTLLDKVLSAMKQLQPAEHWNGEAEIRSLLGKQYHVTIGITAVGNIRDALEISRYLVILSDITEQKDAQGALIQLANYDSLTGLPNRSLLLDRIQHAFDQATRDKTAIGLFFIDLDRFKQINDSLGHDAGDVLLQEVALRLQNLLRQSDTVARLGGDEFVVMIEKVQCEQDLSYLAGEMIQTLAKSVTLKNQVVSVSASIGIAMYPEDASTPAELLKNADIAMYHAKELGSDNFQYFTSHMNERTKTKLKLEHAVKHAFASQQFISYYQPIVACKTGQVAGFEMLMRWPVESGMVAPDVFIPVAEDIGLIEDMTFMMIEQAVPLLKHIQSLDTHYYLSVNLSAKHISRSQRVDEIVQLLARHNVPTSAIRFEITESALMSDYESAMDTIAAMKKKGFIIALDDFGTGYSSLKYLKDFPIDILKIDKTFVKDIGVNAGNEAIILAILRMAESLNIQCIAEGIETSEQVKFFQAEQCEYLQGYFYSKPVSESAVYELIREGDVAKLLS
ncbi:EAL domain-containing protein [Salinimonas lutimaris]|uniref:EAL domain-containing protein n=1 Tax=Salinimonas lutimaris TaxID=914153 RepID=UPI0010BFECA7|nr:EAL domain-containing protein [Salinimonas lutimaris]